MKKIKKTWIIVTISIFALGIILAVTGIVITFLISNPKPIENQEEKEPDNLLGIDRLESQQKVTSAIDNYIKQIPNLEEYLKEHDKTSLTIKEMKDDLHIDTSEIEKLEYGCNLEGTLVDFQDGIDNYKILISCDICKLF